jgi:hypothetical protein
VKYKVLLCDTHKLIMPWYCVSGFVLYNILSLHKIVLGKSTDKFRHSDLLAAVPSVVFTVGGTEASICIDPHILEVRGQYTSSKVVNS